MERTDRGDVSLDETSRDIGFKDFDRRKGTKERGKLAFSRPGVLFMFVCYEFSLKDNFNEILLRTMSKHGERDCGLFADNERTPANTCSIYL